MIPGFVIDEHGNLITGQQLDESMSQMQKWADDLAPAFEAMAQIGQQLAQAFDAFGAALGQAFTEAFGPLPEPEPPKEDGA